ncbi:hypothetical protein [Mycolicibacterium hippocampi]|uniref:Uncharacterized protein n=1 Tax=Mycolicibacterium hippocampi TaxID=659824 RepID=A0A7I9ZH13_9MYCO|nr:hypothetical protein [Mycolicibacterium hippocampi]GFH00149.1 hypothetical protein MHIP_06320 [Mycolicibacterium hippocampi]
MTAGPDIEILADHPIWIAVPAFAPAIVVAGVVVYIAVKNRKKAVKNQEDEPKGQGRP